MVLPFDPEGFPVTNVLHSGSDSNPPSGAGVQATLAADASATVATVQVGRWYLLSLVGGDPVALSFSGAAANRLTGSAWYPGTKYQFQATTTTVTAQKFLAGSVSPTIVTEPLDGGTVA